LFLGIRAHQLIAFMINDGITGTIHVPLQKTPPDALARALLVKDGNGVFPILHSEPDVEEKVSQAGRLVAALAGRKIRAVVLISGNGQHGSKSRTVENGFRLFFSLVDNFFELINNAANSVGSSWPHIV
jgi:hypothetical protein